MVWSYVLNGFMATIILVTYLFAIPSLDDALDSDFPFVYVFQECLSPAGVNALTILIMLLVIAANIDYNASTSRQTFAFARDKGFPFHSWLGAVHPKLHIPANAIATTCLITCLLALINIGSSVAFNAIISLQIVALMFSYAISISCVLYRRLAHPELLPPARWSLGKWGVLINSVGLAYAIFAFFWCFWPGETPVDAESMNWGVVMFVGVAIVCALSYAVQGRKIYKGPVSTVVGREHDL
jgi:amino acid transporter